MKTIPLMLRALVAVCCLPSFSIAATPIITDVSGTVQTGLNLTITGSNMVNEDKTNWDTFFQTNTNASSFEGANPAADGYRSISSAPYGTYDSTVKLLGNKSAKFHVQGAASPPGNLYSADAIDPAGGNRSDLWIRFYARWSLNGGGWPTSHIKTIDSQGSAGGQFYFQPAATNGELPSRWVATWDDGAGNTGHYANNPSGQLQNNRWYGIELHWKNTVGGNVFAAWVDGVQIFNAVPPLSDYVLDYILIGVINASGTNSSFNLDHWWDGFAISTTRVRLASIIEIGNSSDYATATKVYQAPVSLSDTSTQVKVNVTGLPTGPRYLWVTNNRGERSLPYDLSSVGFPIPQNLRAQ